MILWRGSESGGEGGEMMIWPAVEPLLRDIFRTQQERHGRDLRGLQSDRLEERKDVVAIKHDFVHCVVRRREIFCCLVLGVLGVLFIGPTCDVSLQILGGGLRSLFRDLSIKCIQ